jgi:uncharacterized membrane protein YccF (DUF307 family)
VTAAIRVLWLLLVGIWLGLAYLVAAALSAALTGGGPFASAALRLARYAVWPFDRALVGLPSEPSPRVTGAVWVLTAGWWLALVHVAVGVLLCLTVIGLPFGVVSLTLLPLSFAPLRAQVRPAQLRTEARREVAAVPASTAPARLLAA